MKTSKIFLVATLILTCCMSAVQAQKLKNFLDNQDSSFTWLGVDFTQARVIADAGVDATDVINRHFAGINQVIVNEPKKYDVPGSLRHKNVTYDISLVNKHNLTTSSETLKSDNANDFHRLTPEDVAKLVKNFNFEGKKGIGVLLVMDGMSKTEKSASMYLTIIDMGTKHVLMTERMDGKAQGFGFRNYWAYTVYKVLDHFDDDYKKFQAKYADAKDPVEEQEQPKKQGKTAVAEGSAAPKKAKKKG